MYSWVPLVKGVRLVGGVWARHKKPTQDATKASPQGLGSPSTIGILQGGIWSLYNDLWGTHPQLNRGLPNLPRSFRLNEHNHTEQWSFITCWSTTTARHWLSLVPALESIVFKKIGPTVYVYMFIYTSVLVMLRYQQLVKSTLYITSPSFIMKI